LTKQLHQQQEEEEEDNLPTMEAAVTCHPTAFASPTYQQK